MIRVQYYKRCRGFTLESFRCLKRKRNPSESGRYCFLEGKVSFLSHTTTWTLRFSESWIIGSDFSSATFQGFQTSLSEVVIKLMFCHLCVQYSHSVPRYLRKYKSLACACYIHAQSLDSLTYQNCSTCLGKSGPFCSDLRTQHLHHLHSHVYTGQKASLLTASRLRLLS